ncbi:hypothetical protein L0F63_000801 [Massospora cicadina]|nr:hypothetical protein L0F63_000801 [Massospora cicadina]
MKQSKRGVPRPKPPDSLTPPQLGALDSQLQNLSLSTSSLDSSGASSSGRQSLSSVASDISPVNHPLRPTRVEPRATSTISLREAIRIRQEEESRRCKAQALRLQARQNLPTPPHASYYPFAMFIEDDSDDFDGFSEDEI